MSSNAGADVVATEVQEASEMVIAGGHLEVATFLKALLGTNQDTHKDFRERSRKPRRKV
jgi:hypothetical protein